MVRERERRESFGRWIELVMEGTSARKPRNACGNCVDKCHLITDSVKRLPECGSRTFQPARKSQREFLYSASCTENARALPIACWSDYALFV